MSLYRSRWITCCHVGRGFIGCTRDFVDRGMMTPSSMSSARRDVCAQVIACLPSLCRKCLGASVPYLPWPVIDGVLICCGFRHEPSGSPLKPFLLLDPETDKGVEFEFINEAVKRFDEDESIKPAFIAAVEDLSQELAEMNINDDYKPHMTVC